MAMVVTLRRPDGTVERELPDPVGGTFDAAGDFDTVLDSLVFPLVGGIDPYGDTALSAEQMPALLTDIRAALVNATGSQRRGLLRLSVMAERCLAEPALALRFEGD